MRAQATQSGCSVLQSDKCHLHSENPKTFLSTELQRVATAGKSGQGGP